jgi:hypothetical protein
MGKVQLPKIERDPARAELARHIAERDAKADAVVRAKASAARVNEMVAEAERHAATVKAALASVRNGHEARLRQEVEGGGGVGAALSSREARFAELDAADELEAARKVLTDCMSSLADAEEDARRARARVEAAVAPVLGGFLGQLLDDAEALQASLTAKVAALAFVTSVVGTGGPEEGVRIARVMPRQTPGVQVPDFRSHPAFAAWREASEALQRMQTLRCRDGANDYETAYIF